MGCFISSAREVLARKVNLRATHVVYCYPREAHSTCVVDPAKAVKTLIDCLTSVIVPV